MVKKSFYCGFDIFFDKADVLPQMNEAQNVTHMNEQMYVFQVKRVCILLPGCRTNPYFIFSSTRLMLTLMQR